MNEQVSEQPTNPKMHPLDLLCLQVKKANAQWWHDIVTGQPKQRNFGELMMLAVSELAEALEGDRKNLMDDKLPQYAMRNVEIVDCLIRLFDTAGNLIPNVGEIYDAKMAFNASREDHKVEHRLSEGGKKY